MHSFAGLLLARGPTVATLPNQLCVDSDGIIMGKNIEQIKAKV